MLKRLFAVLGCVLVVVSCFVVPVGAEQVQAPSTATLVGILTNEYLGMSNGQYFLLRTEDGVDPLDIVNGNTYFISQYSPPFDVGVMVDSFVANEDGIPNATTFVWDYMGIMYNIEVEWSPDGYMLGFDDGLEYQYLGAGVYDSVYTFYIYESQTGGAYEQGYRDGYADGYDKGLEDGKDLGYEDGYEKGYEKGDDDGYIRGYNAGLEKATGISWTGLFTSAIEVPINVLQGILNFEILGVNLWSFFGAIVTLCIVLIIVKWVV